jgi:hypothetical protein
MKKSEKNQISYWDRIILLGRLSRIRRVEGPSQKVPRKSAAA